MESRDKEKLREILDELAESAAFPVTTHVEVNTQNSLGETPLHVMAIRGDVEGGNLLLLAGADKDAKGEHGYTPMHEAIQQEMPEFVRLLLEAGASITIKNDEGFTSYQCAHMSENADIRHCFGLS